MSGEDQKFIHFPIQLLFINLQEKQKAAKINKLFELNINLVELSILPFSSPLGNFELSVNQDY